MHAFMVSGLGGTMHLARLSVCARARAPLRCNLVAGRASLLGCWLLAAPLPPYWFMQMRDARRRCGGQAVSGRPADGLRGLWVRRRRPLRPRGVEGGAVLALLGLLLLRDGPEKVLAVRGASRVGGDRPAGPAAAPACRPAVATGATRAGVWLGGKGTAARPSNDQGNLTREMVRHRHRHRHRRKPRTLPRRCPRGAVWVRLAKRAKPPCLIRRRL